MQCQGHDFVMMGSAPSRAGRSLKLAVRFVRPILKTAKLIQSHRFAFVRAWTWLRTWPRMLASSLRFDRA
jgi:hypothetical protein